MEIVGYGMIIILVLLALGITVVMGMLGLWMFGLAFKGKPDE